MKKIVSLTIFALSTFASHGMELPQEKLNKKLRRAAAHNDKEKIAWLLTAGADINAPDTDGLTPLNLAVKVPFKREVMQLVMQLLLAHADIKVNAADNYGKTPLHWSTLLNNQEAMKLLLARADIKVNAADNYGWTPLHLAVSCSKQKQMKLLLARADTKVNATGMDGRTPLHEAVGNNNREAMKLLLAHADIQVNTADNHGWTPLHLAAGLNHQEAARLLLVYRADINALGGKDRTPLMQACINNHEKMVALLLSHNALTTLKDRDGNRAFDYAEIPKIRALLTAQHRPLIDEQSRHIFLEYSCKKQNIATIITNREKGKR